MFILAGAFFINPNLKNDFKTALINKSYLILILLFFIYALSGFYSSDFSYYLERLRIKLPFLFMPFAFIGLKELRVKTLLSILQFFVVVIFITALGVLINYLIHFQAINTAILAGKTLPAPIHHIRFSLLIAIASGSSMYLLEQKFYSFTRKERWFTAFVAVFLVIFLHIFAVRSGLLAFYLMALIYISYFILNRRKYIAGAVLLGLLIIMPIIAYYNVTSFKNKLLYMKYDIELFRKGEVYEGLSDSRRLASLIAGIEIFKEHPIIGVGIGDVRDKTNEVYQKRYSYVPQNTIIHNQYIFILAATGIVGLILSLFVFLYPVFSSGNYKSWLFVAVNAILLMSFFVEATLETQIGTAVYIFFVLYIMVLTQKVRSNTY